MNSNVKLFLRYFKFSRMFPSFLYLASQGPTKFFLLVVGGDDEKLLNYTG